MPLASAARVFLVGVGVSMAPLASAAAAGTANLVDEGRRLFFTETFAGNGRTCGTCHPADNNYTIDAAYIARLPTTDPLLVARFPRRPGAAAQAGPGRPCMPTASTGRACCAACRPCSASPARSVPDFGRRRRDRIDAASAGRATARPGGGSLRDFATGAVREHLARVPARVEGADFRLPTRDELRALEKFMRSLGRGRGRARARRLHRRDLPLAPGRGRPRAVQHRGIGAVRPLPPQRHRAQRGPASTACSTSASSAAAIRPAHRLDPTCRPTAASAPAPPVHRSPPHRLWRRPVQHAVPDRGRGHRALVSRQLGGDDRGRGPVLHHARPSPTRPRARRSTSASTSDDIIAIAALLRTLNAIENIRSSNAFLDAGAGPATRSRPAAAAAGARRHRATRSPCSPAARDSSMPPATALIRRRAAARARGGADSAGDAARLSAAPRDRAEARRRVT